MKSLRFRKSKSCSKEEKQRNKGHSFFKKAVALFSVLSSLVLFSPSSSKADMKLQWGGRLASNEGGASVSGMAKMRYQSNPSSPFILDMDGRAGAMWFREAGYPFASFNIEPRYNINWTAGKTSLRAYLNLSLTDVNSYLYIYPGLGITHQYDWENSPLDKKRIRFKFMTIGTFGFSFPKYDDIYYVLYSGVSANWNNQITVYTIPRFFFAASTPMRTAYALYYKPEFQGVEMGVNIRDESLEVGFFGDYDRLFSKVGVKLEKTLSIGNLARIKTWAKLGLGLWSPELPGKPNFVSFIGLDISLGKDPPTIHEVRFSHQRLGRVARVSEDINTPPLERPQSLYEQAVEELAMQKMLSYESFEEFAASYKNSSLAEKILVARWLGKTIGRMGYAYDAFDSLTKGDFFDDSVKRIANASYNDIYSQVRNYILWYVNHGSFDGMPEEYKKGMAVCAGIHSLMAEFLRKNGVDAGAITVNSRNGAHVITLVLTPEATMLLDYGNLFIAPPGNFDALLRYYSFYEGKPVFSTQIFKHEYIGTYITAEGQILHWTFGSDYSEKIKRFLSVE